MGSASAPAVTSLPQMKKCTDIIIEKQICDNFTIKDGIFENNFEVDKYIINTVKKQEF